MKTKITLLTCMLLIISVFFNGVSSQTYDDWRTSHGLAEGSEHQNPDGDAMTNFEEYAMLYNPTVSGSPDAFRFVISGTIAKLQINGALLNDVFFQIMSSASESDAASAYPDWEIFASKWGGEQWIGDYPISEEPKNDNANNIVFTVPPGYEDRAFRIMIEDEDDYPDYDQDHVNLHVAVVANRNTGNLTTSDLEFVVSQPFGRGLPTKYTPEVNAAVPSYKDVSYLNSGIIINDSYPGLSDDQYILYDERQTPPIPAIYSNGYYIFDWRKPLGVQRRKDIVTEAMSYGRNGMFFDAWDKVGNATVRISSNSDKVDLWKGYYDYMAWIKEKLPGVRIINIDVSERHANSFNSMTSELYTTTEGVLNDNFNAIYDESWDRKGTRAALAEHIDWVINKWTRHGKTYIHNGFGLVLSNHTSIYRAAIFLTVMGKHTYYEGNSDGTGYSGGNWKSPEWLENVVWRPLGNPLSEAVRDGYVYTRDFEHATVICDVDSEEALIKWYNEDGTLNTIWGNLPDVAVTNVNVSPNNASLDVEDTLPLSAAVSPSNACTHGVTWSSSDTTIATVDSKGMVTGVSSGSVVITAKTVDGHITDSSNITVTGTLSTPSIPVLKKYAKLYPAPVENNLTIELQDSIKEKIIVEIFTTLGQILITENIENKIENINLSHLKSGVYLIRIKGDTTLQISKIIKR